MSVHLGISYAAFYGEPFEEALVQAHARGFSAIQLIPDQTPNLCEELTSERRTTIRKAAAELGLRLSLHNVFYDINLTSLVPAVSAAALAITRDVLLLARDLGADSVVVHPGYMFPGWRRDDRQRARFRVAARDALRAVCDDAERTGVRVLFENGSYCLTTPDRTPPVPLHLGITPEEMADLLSLVESRAGMCLDVNKALRSGATLLQFAAAAGKALEQLQMSTVESYWSHIQPLLDRLLQQGFAGSIVLEGSSTETANAERLLRPLLAAAESQGPRGRPRAQPGNAADCCAGRSGR